MKYHRTRKGLTRKIYHAQVQSSKRRKHTPPEYTMLELRDWIFSQSNFEELYLAWLNSDFDRNLVPSIDRLNDDIGYKFSNIRLVAWHINNNKAHKQIVNGENLKSCKAIIQYDMDGNFIAEYHSINHASRTTNLILLNLYPIVRERVRQAGGYKWSYK